MCHCSFLDPVFRHTNVHTYATHTHTLYFLSRSKTKLLCIYSVGNCPYCTILAMMCSHLSKSMEPRNWYYSFNGSFSPSPSLSISLSVSVFAHAWMRKSDYLRKKGVSTLVKGGSCVSAVSVKRLPLHLCTSPDCLISPPLLFRLECNAHTHHSTMSQRHNEVHCKCSQERQSTHYMCQSW